MFKTLLERIGRELRKGEIPYMIIGGQAVLLYGEPRLTEDARIILLKNPGLDSVYIRKWLDEFDRSLGETFRGQFEQIYKESRSITNGLTTFP